MVFDIDKMPGLTAQNIKAGDVVTVGSDEEGQRIPFSVECKPNEIEEESNSKKKA